MAAEKAFIYTRISQDRAGAGLGVGRQREDCEALAASLGYEVAEVFEDNDISAYSGKRRPGYRAMLARLGEVQAVLCWHTDRLHRSPLELEEYIALTEAAGVTTRTVKAGDLDLGTPHGRLIARQLGSLARYESEHKAERIARKRQDKVKRGEWAGGPRPFGWDIRDKALVVNEGEAAFVREAHERVISGEPLGSVVRSLNERGARTPVRGAEWGVQEFRRMLLRPRNAGLSTLRGEVLGKLQAEALVSMAQHEAVKAVLRDPRRRTSPSNRVEHLGSGIYECPCGRVVYTGKASYRGKSWRVYRCEERGAGHVAKKVVETDEVVSAAAVVLKARLARAERTGDRERSAELEAELAALEARYAEAAELHAAGELSMRMLAQTDSLLEKQRQAILEELAAVGQRDVEAEGTAGLAARLEVAGSHLADAQREWVGMHVDERRAFLRRHLRVVLLPLPRTSARRFDPSTVQVSVRGSTMG